MKVLIWFLTIFVATLLNGILGLVAGFKAGYLVVYIIVIFVAKKLCQKWDEHKQAKATSLEEKFEDIPDMRNTAKNDLKVSNIPAENMATSMVEHPEPRTVRFCRRCGCELIAGSRFCSRCGNEIETEDHL